jgi:putative mRNA 3-end processing factor
MPLLRHDLYIEPIKAFIDPPRPQERALITHGHADHARAGHGHVLATRETIEIMKKRYGENCASSFQAVKYGERLNIDGVGVTFYPAGHVLGSAQILLEHDGCRAVVTGDYKRQSDPTCPPFEPIPCDLIVTEATFALPVFSHPDVKGEIQKLLNSVETETERCHLIAAYPLGKTQRVIAELRQAGYENPVYLHGSMMRLCETYRDLGVDLGDLRKIEGLTKDELKGRIVIAPTSAVREKWSRRLPDPVLCQASGWMTIKQRAKQSGVELPLIISDHCDWGDLLYSIRECGAETVWVTHGREDALIHQCRAMGLKAEPLHLQGREEDDSG